MEFFEDDDSGLDSPYSAYLVADGGGPSPLESQFESAWANLHIEEAAASTNTVKDESTYPYEEKDGYRVHPRLVSDMHDRGDPVYGDLRNIELCFLKAAVKFSSKNISNPLKLIARVEILENSYLKAGFNSAAAEIQDGLDGDPIKEQILFYQSGLKDMGAVLRAGFPQGEANLGKGLAFSKYVGSFIARGKSRHKSLLLCRCLDGGLEDVDTEGVQHFFDSRIVLPYCVVYLEPGAQDLIHANSPVKSVTYSPGAYYRGVHGARPFIVPHQYSKVGKLSEIDKMEELKTSLKQTVALASSPKTATVTARFVSEDQTDLLKPYTNPRLCTKMDEDFDVLAWSATDQERQHSLDMLRDDVDKVGLKLKDLETHFEEEQSGLRQQVTDEVRVLMTRRSEALRQRVDLELSGTRGQGREAEVQSAVEAASEHEQMVANTDLECVTLAGLVRMREKLFSQLDEGGSSSESVWLPGNWTKVDIDRKGSLAERLKLARNKLGELEDSMSKENQLMLEQKRLKDNSDDSDIGGAKKKRWDQPPVPTNWRKSRLEVEKALVSVRGMLNEIEREIKGNNTGAGRKKRGPPVKVVDPKTGRIRYRFKEEMPDMTDLTDITDTSSAMRMEIRRQDENDVERAVSEYLDSSSGGFGDDDIWGDIRPDG